MLFRCFRFKSIVPSDVCLEFLFVKNRFHESLWDWVFYCFFFETLWKFFFTLRGQTVHFVHCKRIPQQGRSLYSSFVLYCPLIVPTNFSHFKDLSLESRNIKTQNCAPIQCTVWPRNALQKFVFLEKFYTDLQGYQCKDRLLPSVPVYCPSLFLLYPSI